MINMINRIVENGVGQNDLEISIFRRKYLFKQWIKNFEITWLDLK